MVIQTDDPDEHVFARLCDWLRSAALPAGPYRLHRALVVADPAASHAHLRATVAAGPTGQCRRAVLARLRLLKRLEANGWELEEG